MLASFTALTTRNPRRNEIYSHIPSIISGKESNQRTSDKAENETTNEQTRTSTNRRREERKQKRIPHNYKHLLYFTFKIALQKLPHIKLTKYTVSRITSSQAKHVKY